MLPTYDYLTYNTSLFSHTILTYNVKIEWENAKVVKQLHNINELTIVEEIQIFAGSHQERVINEKQSINLSEAWKFTLNKRVQHNGSW